MRTFRCTYTVNPSINQASSQNTFI